MQNKFLMVFVVRSNSLKLTALKLIIGVFIMMTSTNAPAQTKQEYALDEYFEGKESMEDQDYIGALYHFYAATGAIGIKAKIEIKIMQCHFSLGEYEETLKSGKRFESTSANKSGSMYREYQRLKSTSESNLVKENPADFLSAKIEYQDLIEKGEASFVQEDYKNSMGFFEEAVALGKSIESLSPLEANMGVQACKDELQWERVLMHKSVDQVRLYSKNFPDGRHIDEAREMENELEKTDFDKAMKSENVEIPKNFIRQYPNSKNKKEVQNRIRELEEYAKIRNDPAMDRHEKFLQQYPNSQYGNNIRIQLIEFYEKELSVTKAKENENLAYSILGIGGGLAGVGVGIGLLVHGLSNDAPVAAIIGGGLLGFSGYGFYQGREYIDFYNAKKRRRKFLEEKIQTLKKELEE